MFIIDRLLAAPVHGLLWVARKIKQQADEELADDEAGIHASLAELNRQLEQGLIDEEAFALRETALIDRLEEVWANQPLMLPASTGEQQDGTAESDPGDAGATGEGGNSNDNGRMA